MITKLTDFYFKDFLLYLKKHNTGYDDYFLCDEQLNQFKIEDNITYIKVEKNQIIGVISIMKSFGCRLRLLHAINDDFSVLKDLHLNAMKSLKLNNISKYKVFIETKETGMIDVFQKLGLEVERTIYAFKRNVNDITVPELDAEYSVDVLKIPEDIKDYAEIRNIAFKDLIGSNQRDISFFMDMDKSDDYCKETTLILRHLNKPVAIIKGAKEIEDGEEQVFIGPVAVLPDYQGRGLGKHLLSQVIQTANQMQCPCFLSVNTNNKNALNLYKNLGFYEAAIVVALI
ncbi:MAG: GNAT family N-acetyltransferase [Clostridiales bacterium]|nr:GNAT family N-acetyltransferase [Clostridiales bacterium]